MATEFEANLDDEGADGESRSAFSASSDSTKKQLLELAKQLNITGRHKMTKDQLFEAINTQVVESKKTTSTPTNTPPTSKETITHEPKTRTPIEKELLKDKSTEPKEKIIDLSGMGGGVIDNMYVKLWDDLQSGSMAKMKKPPLFEQMVLKANERGLVRSIDDLRSVSQGWTGDFEQDKKIGIDNLNNLLTKYNTKTPVIPKEPTTPETKIVTPIEKELFTVRSKGGVANNAVKLITKLGGEFDPESNQWSIPKGKLDREDQDFLGIESSNRPFGIPAKPKKTEPTEIPLATPKVAHTVVSTKNSDIDKSILAQYIRDKGGKYAPKEDVFVIPSNKISPLDYTIFGLEKVDEVELEPTAPVVPEDRLRSERIEKLKREIAIGESADRRARQESSAKRRAELEAFKESRQKTNEPTIQTDNSETVNPPTNIVSVEQKPVETVEAITTVDKVKTPSVNTTPLFSGNEGTVVPKETKVPVSTAKDWKDPQPKLFEREQDYIYDTVVDTVSKNPKKGTIRQLRKTFGIGSARATKIRDMLVNDGIVKPVEPILPRSPENSIRTTPTQETIPSSTGNVGQPPKPPKPPAPPASPGEPDEDPYDAINKINKGKNPDDSPNIQKAIPNLTKKELEKQKRKEELRIERKAARIESRRIANLRNELRDEIKTDRSEIQSSISRRAEIDKFETNVERRQQIQDLESTTDFEKQDKDTATDRVLKRLGGFGLARSAKLSGTLVASLLELSTFQPEEQEQDRLRNEEKKRIAEKKQELRDQFKFEDIQNKYDVKTNKNDLTQDHGKALSSLAGANTEEEINSIRDAFRNKVKTVKATVVPTQPGQPQLTPLQQTLEAEKQLNAGSGSGGGGTVPPSSGGSFEPPENNEPKPQPNQPTPDTKPKGFVDNLKGVTDGLSVSTKIIAGANIGLEALRLASNGLTSTIKETGKAFSDLDNTPEIVKQGTNIAGTAVGLGGLVAGGAVGGLAGPAIGAAFGTAVGGPLGTVIGAVAGKVMADSVMEPLSALVNSTVGLLDASSKESIGPQTLDARVSMSIESLERRIENSFKLDSLTAQYVMAQTELASALNDAKIEFLTSFGPPIIDMLKVLTAILETINKVTPSISGSLDNVLINGIHPGLGFLYTLVEYLRPEADTSNKNVSLEKELSDFFVSRKQFQDKQGNDPIMNNLKGFKGF